MAGSLTFVPYLVFFVAVAIQSAVVVAVALLLLRCMGGPGASGRICGGVLAVVLLAEAVAWLMFAVSDLSGGFAFIHVQAGAYGVALLAGATWTGAITVGEVSLRSR